MIDIEKLSALAEAATPSKWSTSGSYVAPTREEDGTTYVENWRSIAMVQSDEDREFIAAANPAAVLELIAEIKTITADRDAEKAMKATARLQRDLQLDLATKRGEERDQLKAENEALRKDASRLDRLDMECEGYGCEVHEGNRWILDGPFNSARDAIDALPELKLDHDYDYDLGN